MVLIDGVQSDARFQSDARYRTRRAVASQLGTARAGRQRRDFDRGTLDALSAHVAVIDAGGSIIAVNRPWLRFAAENGAPGLGVGSNYLAVCDETGSGLGHEQVGDAIRAILSGECHTFETEYPCHAPGEERWFHLRLAAHVSDGPRRVVVQHTDITGRVHAERAAQMREELLDSIRAAVVGTDLTGNITTWSAGAEALLGWTEAEALGESVVGLTAPDEVQIDAIRDQVGRTGRWDGTLDFRRRDGARRVGFAHISSLVDDRGDPSGYVGVASDATERVHARESLARASDHLSAVTESMGEALVCVDEAGRATSMNPAAEELLGWPRAELVGRVMHETIHHHRPDGSEYPAEECPISKTREVGRVVRVDEDLFFRRDGSSLWVSYVASPLETEDGREGSVVIFRDITEQRTERARLEAEIEGLSIVSQIRDALDEDRMELFAQPIVDLSTGETLQHELLIRMRGQDGSLVPPQEFLPIAERFGYMRPIDCWVVDQASDLLAAGHAVEINLSASSLGDSDLVDHFQRSFMRPGVEPDRLVIEITETALAEDEGTASGFMEEIAALGCSVALDDFGTGYGGFTYLKNLPVHFLKVDREFIRDIRTNEASLHVTEAVVSLAHSFGQKVVAEGVEDEATAELLRTLGVDLAQGYLFGRPAPLVDVFPS